MFVTKSCLLPWRTRKLSEVFLHGVWRLRATVLVRSPKSQAVWRWHFSCVCACHFLLQFQVFLLVIFTQKQMLLCHSTACANLRLLSTKIVRTKHTNGKKPACSMHIWFAAFTSSCHFFFSSGSSCFHATNPVLPNLPVSSCIYFRTTLKARV